MSATNPPEISWADFEKVLLVAGTVTKVEPFILKLVSAHPM